jgi:CRP-like cAMP-binding protein
MVNVDQLKHFKIFKGLNEREVEIIAGIAREETYEARKRIFEEKALANDLYLALDGQVEIKIRGDGDKYVIIDRIEGGDIFGWSAVVEPRTFTAAAWTTKKTNIIILGGEELGDIFEKNTHIGYRVVREIAAVISRRLKAMEKKFVETMRQAET